MQFFEAIEASVLLGTILISITVGKRFRFKGRITHSRRILATTLVSSMLLLGMFFAGVQSVNGSVPTYASGSGASFNVTEYVTGTNTTSEIYNTTNSFSNLTRDASITIMPPTGFSTTVISGTITVKEMTAVKDYRLIEDMTNGQLSGSEWTAISMSFEVKSPVVNITKIWVVYRSFLDPTGTFDIQGADSEGKPNGTSYLPGGLISLGTPPVNWHEMLGSTNVTLQKGQYCVVLNETSGDTSNYYQYYYTEDDTTGDNGTGAIEPRNTQGEWLIPNNPYIDFPFRMIVLPLDPNDISKVRTYSGADQVDMKFDGVDVGSDNQASFSSTGTHIFTTNTSITFQKTWSGSFSRSGGTASSNYYVTNTTDTQWNLTYSIGAVSGGSATSYSSRYVDITSVPNDWNVYSASVGTPSKPSSDTVMVTFEDLLEHIDAVVTCISFNYITQLSTSGPVILGNSITLNATMISQVSGNVTFRIYNPSGDQVGSNQTDILANDDNALTTFTIGESEPIGMWTAVAGFINTGQNEAGFKTSMFEVLSKTEADIDFDREEYNASYGDKVLISFKFHYGETGLEADTVTLNGTVPEWVYGGNGWHNITYYTDSLSTAGDFVLDIHVTNSEYVASGQIDLHVEKIPVILIVSVSTKEVEAGDSFTVYAILTLTDADSTPLAVESINFNFMIEKDGTVYWNNASSITTGEGVAEKSLETTDEMEGATITPYVEFGGNATIASYSYELTGGVKVTPPKAGFMEEFLDYLPYIILLLLGAFASIAVTRTYSARRQKRLDRENIRRIMVIFKSFALYDQTPSEIIAEGHVADKELVSGFFTAIKDITTEVTGTTLVPMIVYHDHPYYFVYTGTFYCVLILSDKPSPRLEDKVLCFAVVVEEKYGKIYSSDLFGVMDMRLDLDEEVMQIFGITPAMVLQEVVTVSLSYEEIDELKVRDDVKKVLRAGSVLADQKKEFPLGELIQATKAELGDDIRAAHEAVIEAIRLGLLIVVKRVITELEMEPGQESVERVEEEKKERRRVKEEFFEKYYGSVLSLEGIDLKKDIGEEERLVLKYVRAYNEQVGKGIKGETLIEGLKEEFKDEEEKVIKALKNALKSGYLQETTEEGLFVVAERAIPEEEKPREEEKLAEREKIEKVTT